MPAMIGFVLAASKYCLFDCKDFKPDLIHVHFAVPNGPVAMLASRRFKVPYVITAHLGDIPGASPEKTAKWFRYIFPFTKTIWKKAAKVIAVSRYSRRMAVRSYDVPVDVIPNGIDYDKICNRDFKRHDKPRIVFAGRFVPQKNLIQIVKVLARLKDYEWNCVLIGDGQDREMITRAIFENDLQNRFQFTGWKTPEEVIEIFHDSDILFLPSTSEGLPVVGIQAMSSGLALVLSDAGGNPEIVDQNCNGMVNEPHDTDGFVRDMKKLLSDPDLLFEMRQYSLEKAKSFDIGNMAVKYLKAFDEVIRNKR